MHIDQELSESLLKRLQFLYGDKAEECLRRIDQLVQTYAYLNGNHKNSKIPYTHKDVYLITYGDSVKSGGEYPLETLKKFADSYLKNLINGIHILPFFPYSSDDGFSVIDYRQVREDLGNWKHIKELSKGYKVMADLVINHVSSESLWFKAFRDGKGRGSDFFHVMNPLENLSNVTRPRNTPVLTATDTRGGVQHVWTTFSSDQVDVNFANPEVLLEYLDILLFYLSMGIRVIRLDAVAFLWKRAGTPCIHLDETHEIVKLVRELAEHIAPDAIIITETNVPHKENISYFGEGDEAHMVYNFSLPPLLLHAIITQNASYLSEWSRTLTPPPEGCTYFNFAASHDGIGVRPLEGLVPQEEFEKVVSGVKKRGGHVSTKKNPDGNDSPYELNITYFSAMSDPFIDDIDIQIRRFMCSQALMLGFRGVPAIYVHSFTATKNDYAGVEESGRARSINRKKWEWDELRKLMDDPESTTAKVMSKWDKLLKIRRSETAFDPSGGKKVLDSPRQIFAMKRISPDDSSRILIIGNVAREEVTWKTPFNLEKAQELISGKAVNSKEGVVSLKPWQVMWIKF